LVLGMACSKRAGGPDTAAIESAYRSGILTKEEYTARTAAAQARTAKLAALDQALHSGVLSQQEYAAKKAALLTTPAPVESAAPIEPAAVAQTESATPTMLPDSPAPASMPAATPAGAGESQGHVYRMKIFKVLDSQGFEKPLPSHTILVPVDWQSQGATTWNIKDKCNTVQTRLAVSGPDGRGFEQFPDFQWVWADDPRAMQASAQQTARMGSHACDVMAPMGAQDYLRRNLEKVRPGAQLVGFEPAPKLTEVLAQQAHQVEAMARQYNLKQQVKFDAMRARVKYNSNGKDLEEWIFAATVTTGTHEPMGWTYNCVAHMAAERAPAGQLDTSRDMLELVASTLRVDPQWQTRISQNAQATQQIELKGIRDRSAIMTKNAEDIRNIQREGYENRQRVVDSSNEQFSQTLRGVETYRNPGTGETLELDNRYGHAWVNNAGEYLLTDQIGFDPNTVHGNTQSWTQLQHVKQ
jgi:hypothetical protein